MQNLREQLLRTLIVLDAQLEVAEGCTLYCGSPCDSIGTTNREKLLLELDVHTAQLKTHRKAVGAILDRSQGTLDLVSSDRLLTICHDQQLMQERSSSKS